MLQRNDDTQAVYSLETALDSGIISRIMLLPTKERTMSILTGQFDSMGYAPGETAESFRRFQKETLRFVAENARSVARRQLALNELARRAAK